MLHRCTLASVALACFAPLVACESPLEADLKVFCAIVHDVQADKQMPPPKKVDEVDKRATAQIKGPEFAALYEKIAAAAADDRYGILMKAAAGEGMHMWSCFDGRNMWKELGEHERMAAFDAEHGGHEDPGHAGAAVAKADRKAKRKKRKKRRKKRR